MQILACLLTFIAGGRLTEIRGCYTADDPLMGRGMSSHTHTYVQKRLKPKPEQKIFN